MEESAESYITVGILFVALLMSLCGNIVVILSALLYRDLRNNTGLLIMNLAISDLCISCFSLPLRLCQMLGFDWSDSYTSCGLTVAFTICFFTASNFNLYLVTLDRFLGVLWPIKYRIRMSRRKINVAICFSWILAFVIAFFPKVVIGEQENDNISKLNFICTFGTVLHPAYLTFMEVFTLFIPWTLMVIMYSAILRTVFKGTTEPLTENADQAQIKVRRSERKKLINRHRRAKEIKLAKGIFVIVIIYSVLMVPIAFIDLLELVGKVKVPFLAIKITVLLAYLNPAVNPPVYAATSKKYKDAFARIFSCSRLMENVRGILTSKVTSLNDSFNVRNRRHQKRGNNSVLNSSLGPNASSDSSFSNDYGSCSEAQKTSQQICPKDIAHQSSLASPIFTIKEEVEINFLRPKSILQSLEIEDISENVSECFDETKTKI